MKVLMAMEKAAAANQEEVQEEISIKKEEIKALAEGNPELGILYKKVEDLDSIVAALIKKIDDLRAEITNEGGFYLYEGSYHKKSLEERKTAYMSQGFNNFVLTDNRKLEGKPVDKKNKEITNRILVEEGKGEELKELLNQTHLQLKAKIDEIVVVSVEGIVFGESDVIQLKEELLLELTDDQVYLERGKSSWSEHVFGYMPVAACYPLFRKYQNDAKNSVQQIKAYIDSVLGIEDKE